MKRICGVIQKYMVVVLMSFSLASTAGAAITVLNAQPTDVTPSSFSVVWQTNESAIPDIRVYGDAAGALEITNQVEVTPYPLVAGNPALTSEYEQDEHQAQFRSLMQGQGLMKLRVNGLQPGTTYYFQLVSVGASETVVWPVSGLSAVTTATETSFVSGAHQALVTLSSPNPAGWILIAHAADTPYGVSAIVGDGAGAENGILNLANLYAADGRNWQPLGQQEITLVIYGELGSSFSQTFSINFEQNFMVAQLSSVPISLYGTPVLALLDPANTEYTRGTAVSLHWEDSAENVNGQLALYFDTDGVGEDGTLIVEGLPEDPDGPGDAYLWESTGVEDGVYSIYGVLSDGFTSVSSYAPGTITIDRQGLDGDGDLLSDLWELSFFKTLDRDGTGDFDNDGVLDSVEFVNLTNPTNPFDPPNDSPVAFAGAFRNILIDREFRLDASGSYDPEGALITYSWTLGTTPVGSFLTNADLSDPSSVMPVFVPDTAGEYLFTVQVSDGVLSASDTVTVLAASSNVAPNADAGPDQYAGIGTQLQLDGNRSYDVDTNQQALTFSWRFTQLPALSALTNANLVAASTATVWFTPDVEGSYEVTLRVDDGQLTSEDSVVVTAMPANVTPNARAGQDQVVTIGGVASMNALASFDPDNAPGPLSYAWRFVSVPVGSGLANSDISMATNAIGQFTPDIVGVYVLEVMVSDSLAQDYDNVAVIVAPLSPEPTDLNNDGMTNLQDRDVLLAILGARSGDPNFNGKADYDSDGEITMADYSSWYSLYMGYRYKHGDYDRDGDYDAKDMAGFAGYYSQGQDEADVNEDGSVNGLDVKDFAKRFAIEE